MLHKTRSLKIMETKFGFEYGSRPYIPEITYPGAFSEDATLKTWIAALADRHHHEVRNN